MLPGHRRYEQPSQPCGASDEVGARGTIESVEERVAGLLQRAG